MDKITIDKHTYARALSELAAVVGTLKGINGALQTFGNRIDHDKLNSLIEETHSRSEKTLQTLLQQVLATEQENPN